MELPYTGTVRSQLPRHPCLANLLDFMTQSGPNKGETRVASLVVDSATRKAVVSETGHRVVPEVIDRFLGRHGAHAQAGQDQQLLLVENIDRRMLSKLGHELGIDPLFFASHVHSPWRDMNTATPSVSELPSTRRRNFASFNYHRTYIFSDLDHQDYRLLRLSNIRRKVDVLPSIRGKRLGIAQHCCSTLVLTRGSSWLGVVLVDSPPSKRFTSLRQGEEVTIFASFEPLLGGTEDFSPTAQTLVSEKGSSGPPQSTASAMFDELIWHWGIGGALNTVALETRPLPFVLYYPIRLIAGEWISYTSAMCFAMKQYEVAPSRISYEDLDQMALAHAALDSWSRRALSSKAHVDAVIWLLRHQQEKGVHDDDWRALLEDFNYIRSSLTEHAARIENVASLVYSHIHLAETRRAFSEAKNISRLTILALFFVPLNYVSSIFSMSENFVPGGAYFWVYFVVAVPVLLLVFGLAQFRTRIFH